MTELFEILFQSSEMAPIIVLCIVVVMIPIFYWMGRKDLARTIMDICINMLTKMKTKKEKK